MRFVVSFLNFTREFSNVVQTFVKIIFLSKWSSPLPEKNGDKIAFLANGPSLPEALEKMKSEGLPENIMVANFFCNSELFLELKPNFYIFCDPLFSRLSDEDPHVEQFYRTLYQKTAWDMVLFVPVRFRKAINKILKQLELSNSKIRIYHYNSTNFNGDNKLNYWFFKHRLGMPRPTTVAVPGLMTCIWMGYKSVEIAGIDLNQHQDITVTKSNELMLRSVHFYSQEEKLVPFYKNKKKNQLYSSSEIFLIFHYFFYSFDIIAKFASTQAVEIVNYSDKSFLDQFKKI